MRAFTACRRGRAAGEAAFGFGRRQVFAAQKPGLLVRANTFGPFGPIQHDGSKDPI